MLPPLHQRPLSRLLPLPPAACRFEMRIHKRLIDLHSPAEVVKQITSIRWARWWGLCLIEGREVRAGQVAQRRREGGWRMHTLTWHAAPTALVEL